MVTLVARMRLYSWIQATELLPVHNHDVDIGYFKVINIRKDAFTDRKCEHSTYYEIIYCKHICALNESLVMLRQQSSTVLYVLWHRKCIPWQRHICIVDLIDVYVYTKQLLILVVGWFCCNAFLQTDIEILRAALMVIILSWFPRMWEAQIRESGLCGTDVFICTRCLHCVRFKSQPKTMPAPINPHTHVVIVDADLILPSQSQYVYGTIHMLEKCKCKYALKSRIIITIYVHCFVHNTLSAYVGI